MTAEIRALGWSIASPNEIESTARTLSEVRHRYLAGESIDRPSGRPLIVSSWKRCRDMRVDASRRSAPLAISRDAQLEEIRAANEPLLRAAGPVIGRLVTHLSESGYVVVLTDRNGCILQICGDDSVRRRLARIDFIPGGNWSESAAGTNAIGTALADRRPVQLMAAEHFCDGWTDLTCTAAPIRHPITSQVIGVLDITGDYRLIRTYLMSLLAVSALEIEEQLRGMLAAGSCRRQLGGVVPRAARGDARAHGSDALLLTLAGGTMSASLDLDVTLQTVAEQTATLLRVERTAVCLFDDAERGGPFARPRWPDSTLYGMSALLDNAEIIGALRERGEPIIADDISTLTAFAGVTQAAPEVRSVALLPLSTARGIVGFVAALRPIAGRWQFDDLRRAFALMPQAATAIENALLFDALRQHNRHVEAINAMAALLGELADPADHLVTLLARIVRVMDLDAGLLFLRDERNRLAFAAHTGIENAAADVLRTSTATSDLTGLAADVAASGEPRLLPEIDLRASDCGSEFPLRATGCRSALAVPLADGGTIVGVIELAIRRARPLTHADLKTLAAIGQQVCMSLRNAQLRRAAGELEALRQADRLKNEFLATVSHDLRSPLTAIRTSVEGLLDRGIRPHNSPGDGLLHNIAGQANRLSRLVDQLLDVSQIGAGALRLDREWNELPALITDAASGIGALYGGERLHLAIPPDPPLLFVDKDRFVQVLYNLLDNACKYTPPASPIRIEATWNASEMTIGIADRGAGVRASERENIFTRFYRSGSRENAGVRSIGLGLAICRGIVEAHGGRIWVEDNPGSGSVFRFMIPLVAERSPEIGE